MPAVRSRGGRAAVVAWLRRSVAGRDLDGVRVVGHDSDNAGIIGRDLDSVTLPGAFRTVRGTSGEIRTLGALKMAKCRPTMPCMSKRSPTTPRVSGFCPATRALPGFCPAMPRMSGSRPRMRGCHRAPPAPCSAHTPALRSFTPLPDPCARIVVTRKEAYGPHHAANRGAASHPRRCAGRDHGPRHGNARALRRNLRCHQDGAGYQPVQSSGHIVRAEARSRRSTTS